MEKQKGSIMLIYVLLAVPIIAIAYFWQTKTLSNVDLLSSPVAEDSFCRPDPITSSTPRIRTFPYTDDINGLDRSREEEFVRIKTFVPITPDRVLYDPNENANSKHLVPIDKVIQTNDGKIYRVYYPRKLGTSDEGFQSYEFTYGEGQQATVKYSDYGIVFLLQLKHAGATSKEDVPVNERFFSPDITGGDPKTEFYIFDLFKQVSKPKLPETIMTCRNTGRVPGDIVRWQLRPTPSVSTTLSTKAEQVLQLKEVTFETKEFGVLQWFTPACKPLIYLYPQTVQQVQVQVHPKGFFTETIPEYPEGGWHVTAYPNGNLLHKGKVYEHLYYETKIHDSAVTIPQKGYVRKYDELPALYEQILSRLGLNEKESKEFIDYWTKVLPKAPYYFVGIMDEEVIDYIEPLTITPKPDTIIRVRTYFKALEQPTVVIEPALGEIPKRKGFTAVEWGGMVKTDPNHPFTCSQ